MFDITGKEVINKQVEINQILIKLDVKIFESGIYFYYISITKVQIRARLLKSS